MAPVKPTATIPMTIAYSSAETARDDRRNVAIRTDNHTMASLQASLPEETVHIDSD